MLVQSVRHCCCAFTFVCVCLLFLCFEGFFGFIGDWKSLKRMVVARLQESNVMCFVFGLVWIGAKRL